MPPGLTGRTIGALLWVGGGRAVQAVLRLLALVVLARLLSPADFGVVSAAMIVIGFSLIFSHLGLGPAIVQRPEIEARHLDTAFVASVALGLALGGALWWCAPAAARFFSQVDRFEPVLRALAWLFPLAGLSVVAESRLLRELRFRFLAGAEIASFAIGYGVVGVTLAASGVGVWALVAAQLAQAALHTTILLVARPPRLHLRPDRRAFAELMYFGTGFTAAKIANYIALQGDNVIVGRWLGAGALGLYGRAYELMAAPVQLLGEALDRVLFPAMARIQSDRERLAYAFRRGVALIALVMLPTSGVLFVLAPEVIAVLLGAQWTGVVVPFQILALGMFLRTSHRISDALGRAAGAVYRRAWRQGVYATLVIAGAWFGRRWGIEGVAIGVLAALVVHFSLMAQLSLRLLGLTWRGFWALHRPAAFLALVVGSAATGLAVTLRHAHAAPAFLLVITLGATVIVALLAVWVRPQLFLGPDGRWFVGAVWTYVRALPRSASPLSLDDQGVAELKGAVWFAVVKAPAARSLVVELVGPAGVGKSTLAQALRERDPAIFPAPRLWAVPLPSLIQRAAVLLPAAVALATPGRPFSWFELKQLVRLDALHQIVSRAAARGFPIVLLDEGPVFALSCIRVHCARSPGSSRFAALWRRTLVRWAQLLDAVVVLDAPDALLVERIRTRERPHTVKHQAPDDIYRFLARYRAAIAEAVATLSVANGTRRIDCSTAADVPDRVAGRILSELTASPSLC